MSSRNSFGSVRKLPSGAFQARYKRHEIWHKAPATFRAKTEALNWLAGERKSIADETWLPPAVREQNRLSALVKQADEDKRIAAENKRASIIFGTYARDWINTRTNKHGQPLASRTREEYERYLEDRLDEFVDKPLSGITPTEVRTWHADGLKTGKKTSVGRQYDFMKSVFKTAVDDELVDKNPCKVISGSKSSTEVKVTAPTEDELSKIVEAMPDTLKHTVLLGAAAGLRWGEIAALTTDDVEIETDEDGKVSAVKVNVNKAEVRLGGGVKEVKAPKSKAGVRLVSFYGADAQRVAEHVSKIEPGERLTNHTYDGLTYHWRKAREAAGRPDLHFHALRRYQGTRFAQQGATLAEILARLGHSDVKSAMHYQEAAVNRMDELAKRAAR